jgi:CBS domain-containing protein
VQPPLAEPVLRLSHLAQPTDSDLVVVVAAGSGRPLGWAAARGLLETTACDPDLTSAREAIVQAPVVISPADSAGDAAQLLTGSGASHLLVARRGDAAPDGVVTDLDVLRLLGP